MLLHRWFVISYDIAKTLTLATPGKEYLQITIVRRLLEAFANSVSKLSQEGERDDW